MCSLSNIVHEETFGVDPHLGLDFPLSGVAPKISLQEV